jgi:hypothetical protein
MSCLLGANRNPWSKFQQKLKFQEEILSNFSQIQTLEILQFVIQNSLRIWTSSNKESSSLFNSLQIHILFKFVWGLQNLLLTKRIHVDLKMLK